MSWGCDVTGRDVTGRDVTGRDVTGCDVMGDMILLCSSVQKIRVFVAVSIISTSTLLQ